MIAAARVVLAVQATALEFGPNAGATVGELHVRPNSRNTIPGEVRFTIDLRHPDDNVLSKMDDSRCGEIGHATGAAKCRFGLLG